MEQNPRRAKLLDFRHRGYCDPQTPWVWGAIRAENRRQENEVMLTGDDPNPKLIKAVGWANGPLGRKALTGF